MEESISTAGAHITPDAEIAFPTPDWALPPRGRLGYDSDLVEDLFERARLSYSDLQQQRDEMVGTVTRLQAELAELRAEQPLVQSALISAHRTARDVVSQAEQEAETVRQLATRQADEIIEHAHSRARDVVAAADLERAGTEQEVARLRILARGLRDEYRDFVDRAAEILDRGSEPLESVVEMQETLTTAARSTADA